MTGDRQSEAASRPAYRLTLRPQACSGVLVTRPPPRTVYASANSKASATSEWWLQDTDPHRLLLPSRTLASKGADEPRTWLATGTVRPRYFTGAGDRHEPTGGPATQSQVSMFLSEHLRVLLRWICPEKPTENSSTGAAAARIGTDARSQFVLDLLLCQNYLCMRCCGRRSRGPWSSGYRRPGTQQSGHACAGRVLTPNRAAEDAFCSARLCRAVRVR